MKCPQEEWFGIYTSTVQYGSDRWLCQCELINKMGVRIKFISRCYTHCFRCTTVLVVTCRTAALDTPPMAEGSALACNRRCPSSALMLFVEDKSIHQKTCCVLWAHSMCLLTSTRPCFFTNTHALGPPGSLHPTCQRVTSCVAAGSLPGTLPSCPLSACLTDHRQHRSSLDRLMCGYCVVQAGWFPEQGVISTSL